MDRLVWIAGPMVRASKQLRWRVPSLVGRLVDLIYPAQCTWCKEDIAATSDDIALCGDCRAQLAPEVLNWCRRCSAAVTYQTELDEGCIYCRQQQYRFQRVVAVGNYRGELRKAIWATKHPAGEILAQALARLLLLRRREALRELGPDIVVPISMHWRRRMQRGTNGPELMAAELARMLGVPLAARLLRRSKYTPLQAEATLRQRLINQRNSFRVNASRRIRGRRVLLVDDVITTGATCNAAAKALLSAGAKSIVVAVVARAVGDDAL